MLPLTAQWRRTLYSGSGLNFSPPRNYSNKFRVCRQIGQYFYISPSSLVLYSYVSIQENAAGPPFTFSLFGFYASLYLWSFLKPQTALNSFLSILNSNSSVYAEFRTQKLPHLTLGRNWGVSHSLMRTQTSFHESQWMEGKCKFDEEEVMEWRIRDDSWGRNDSLGKGRGREKEKTMTMKMLRNC